MLFWFFYLSISIVLSLSIATFFKKTLKVFVFFLLLGLFSAVWFKEPGSDELSPVISILILEFSIIEDHGSMRLLRPLALSLFISAIFALSISISKFKN
jgi:hypothetical protein|tara:strand:- start:58 stop:354 length:297 start_codon:yes stop_codon:yes gene_type:complete